MEKEKVLEGIKETEKALSENAWSLAWSLYYGKDHDETVKAFLKPIHDAFGQINPKDAMDLNTHIGEDLVGQLAPAIKEITKEFLTWFKETVKEK